MSDDDVRAIPVGKDPVSFVEEGDDGILRCFNHTLAQGTPRTACNHIWKVISDHLDAWDEDNPVPVGLSVPVFSDKTYPLWVSVDEPDENGFFKFVLDRGAFGGGFGPATPRCVGFANVKDGRLGIRAELMPWLVEVGYMPERQCKSDLHGRAVHDKNIATVGATSTLYLTDTLSILYTDKCRECSEVEINLIPDLSSSSHLHRTYGRSFGKTRRLYEGEWKWEI